MAFQHVLDPPDGMEYGEALQSEWHGPNSILVHCSPVRGDRKSLSRLWVSVALSHSLTGWKAESSDLAPRIWADGTRINPPVRNGQTILFSYEPFSFRLGLFLSLVGIALLSATGACCLVRGKGGE